VLPTLNMPVDLLVMDPPRPAWRPLCMMRWQSCMPRQIAYISCDPATLARDVKRILGNGYQLISVTPFDQFPQTGHIESISFFKYIDHS
jgi:23S rRNA (uracil1939-C5)-methyltransferase